MLNPLARKSSVTYKFLQGGDSGRKWVQFGLRTAETRRSLRRASLAQGRLLAPLVKTRGFGMTPCVYPGQTDPLPRSD